MPELRSWLTLVQAALVCSAFASSCRNVCDLLHDGEITREIVVVCVFFCILKRFEVVWCVLHGVCKGFRRCSYGRGYRTILAQFSQLWRRSRTILAHGQAILALFSHLGRHYRTILAHSRTSLALGRQFRPMCLHW